MFVTRNGTEHGLLRYYFYFLIKERFSLKDIGSLFLDTREAAGLSLEEVSSDLNLEKVILENIEDGKTGAFQDIFALKKYISNYAKYLGLDADKIVDEFNEYVFEKSEAGCHPSADG